MRNIFRLQKNILRPPLGVCDQVSYLQLWPYFATRAFWHMTTIYHKNGNGIFAIVMYVTALLQVPTKGAIIFYREGGFGQRGAQFFSRGQRGANFFSEEGVPIWDVPSVQFLTICKLQHFCAPSVLNFST